MLWQYTYINHKHRYSKFYSITFHLGVYNTVYSCTMCIHIIHENTKIDIRVVYVLAKRVLQCVTNCI